MCIHVCTCACVQAWGCPQSLEEDVVTQELELQEVMQSLKRVLGTELGPSERAVDGLKPPSHLSRPGSYDFLWCLPSPVLSSCSSDDIKQCLLSKILSGCNFLGFSINNHSGKSTAPLNRGEKHENRTRQNKPKPGVSQSWTLFLQGEAKGLAEQKRDAGMQNAGVWAQAQRAACALVSLELFLWNSSSSSASPPWGLKNWKLREMAPSAWGCGSKMRRLICLQSVSRRTWYSTRYASILLGPSSVGLNTVDPLFWCENVRPGILNTGIHQSSLTGGIMIRSQNHSLCVEMSSYCILSVRFLPRRMV